LSPNKLSVEFIKIGREAISAHALPIKSVVDVADRIARRV
jgi:hypothetical protein